MLHQTPNLRPANSRLAALDRDVPVHRLVAVALLAIVAAATTTGAAATATPASIGPSTAGAPAVREMFGFREGEQRRYVLESRAFLLEPGEVELWTITLEAIETGAAGSDCGRFLLTHESRRFAHNGNLLNPDEMKVATTSTELVVNGRGFPTSIVHRSESPGALPQELTARFQENQYRIYTSRVMNYRAFALFVPGAERLDLAVPEGVFLAPEINPGLLSIPFALVSSEWGTGSRFLTFDPTPMVNEARLRKRPTVLDASRPPVPGADTLLTRAAPRMLLNRDNFRHRTLSIEEREHVGIGGIETDAYRVRMGGEGRDAWVSPEGAVLRVDVVERRMNAWIRLLRPAEY